MWQSLGEAICRTHVSCGEGLLGTVLLGGGAASGSASVPFTPCREWAQQKDLATVFQGG